MNNYSKLRKRISKLKKYFSKLRKNFFKLEKNFFKLTNCCFKLRNSFPSGRLWWLLVALWLQAATEAGASLTVSDVKDVMEKTAIQDEFTTGTYANRFGKGKIDALAGIRYIHQVYGGKLAIANSSDNSKAITTAAEDGTKTYDVTLCGRTLYKDGKWNTLCLPFDLTIAGSALDGYNVVAMVLDGNASNLTNGVLNLKFDNASATILAGTPFIIKWDNTGENLTESNLVFPNVAISKDKNDVAFKGGAFCMPL